MLDLIMNPSFSFGLFRNFPPAPLAGFLVFRFVTASLSLWPFDFIIFPFAADWLRPSQETQESCNPRGQLGSHLFIPFFHLFPVLGALAQKMSQRLIKKSLARKYCFSSYSYII